MKDSRVHTSGTWIKSILLVAAMLSFLCGLGAFFAAVHLLTSTDPTGGEHLLTFAATVTPASLAAGATIFGVQTWADGRRAARDLKARETLEELAILSVRTVRTLDLEGELSLRARVATWASPKLLTAMAERSTLVDAIGREFQSQILAAQSGQAEGAAVTITLGPRLSDIGRMTADLLSVARADLGIEPASPELIYEGLWSTIDGHTYASSRDRMQDGHSSAAES
ncbi:hypothetical protein [Pseudoclavibacter sp. Z016]|uniref:hypothetical protein n=1 Tax=Pseudoclavibacter sp. Z016 TaxID=2080581 RepID=UPI0011AFEB82|nr:hypothetical protein [Pseudoclavibacter sp. Z016]